MNELPMLFSTEMVQAILSGRKTQTRRIITNKQNLATLDEFAGKNGCDKLCSITPEHLLWVRETWQHTSILNLHPSDNNYGYVYAADGQPWDTYVGWKWRPSIHMPKKAARIWLLVKSVGVERLNDISDEDAVAEGIEQYGPFGEYKGSPHPAGGAMRYRAYQHAARAFQDIWSDIYGPESWEANPWVWVVKYSIVSTTGRPTGSQYAAIKKIINDKKQ
ncbi:MAG: hypothetical protein ACK5JD_06215 [Mangrovibacterium sp.]